MREVFVFPVQRCCLVEDPECLGKADDQYESCDLRTERSRDLTRMPFYCFKDGACKDVWLAKSRRALV